MLNIKNSKKYPGLVAIIAITVIAFLASCSFGNNELQPKRTVISGKVENMSEQFTVIQVNFCDPLSDESRFAQDLTTSGGTFCVAHDYVFAQNITLRYGNIFINLYIAPGDSVFVTIDGLKLPQWRSDAVIFSGDNAQISEQLSRWTDYMYYTFQDPELNPKASPDEYLQSLKQCFDAMQDTIAAYARHNGMNDFMKRWAFADYKFVAANYLDYEDNASKWRVFTDAIFDVYDERNFQSMYFPYHLSACAEALATGNQEIQELLKQNNYNAALHAFMTELSEKAPKGTVRDMMLYKFARRVMNEKPELYDSIPELKSFFSQPVFYKTLESFVRKELAGAKKPVSLTGKAMKGVSRLDNDSIVELAGIELLPYLIERHKDKVLYVDVWASWCGPCLEEMKTAPALHGYFAGKEVVFVNLCLNSTAESWLKTVNRNAIKGENYYLDKNASLLFMGMYNIEGFPTYMLIDTAGQLRSPVARPSNLKSAIKQIEACMH